MKAFFIDLASHQGLLACVTETETIASTEADHRMGDHELAARIESLLKDVGWTLRDLTHIACVTGPGGFTSLRVGVTAANTLAWSLRIPIAGIHLSDLYFARAPLPSPPPTGEGVLWFHSTKKSELFIRESMEVEPRIISLENLSTTYNLQATTWCGELIPEHLSIAQQRGLTQATLLPHAEILPAFLSSQRFSEKSLVPWYGRGW